MMSHIIVIKNITGDSLVKNIETFLLEFLLEFFGSLSSLARQLVINALRYLISGICRKPVEHRLKWRTLLLLILLTSSVILIAKSRFRRRDPNTYEP